MNPSSKKPNITLSNHNQRPTLKASSYQEYSWQDKPRIIAELAEIEKEIAWNERRLENLVWGDDDRKQTEDYVADLRQERKRLLAVIGNG